MIKMCRTENRDGRDGRDEYQLQQRGTAAEAFAEHERDYHEQVGRPDQNHQLQGALVELPERVGESSSAQ
jgi:hypothetical protein